VRQLGIGGLSRLTEAHVDLRTTAGSGEIRYGLGDETTAYGPLATIDYVSTKMGRVAESGAGAFNLSSAETRENWAQYGVGAFFRYGLPGSTGFVDLSARYVRRDSGIVDLDMAMAGSPTGFTVRNAQGSRDALRIDASTEFSLSQRWAISGNIGASQASDEGRIDGSFRLSYRF